MHLNREQAALVQHILSGVRRRLAECSLWAFCQIYMAHHFRLPPCRMHLDMFEVLEEASVRGRGKHIALAGPRRHAKSTVLMGYLLWSICFRKEDFILLISNTNNLAISHLSHIRKELEENELLIEDFPDVAEERGKKPGPDRWRQEDIVTRNGIRVLALGSETSVRGLRHREHRPTLIVADDLENEEQVRSAEQREKLRDWVMKAVLKAGDTGTNVIVTGTVMHPESLLADLLDPKKSPGWLAFKYKAIEVWSPREDYWQTWQSVYGRRDEFRDQTGPAAAEAFFEANRNLMESGTRVLWPEKESYYALMVCKARDGDLSFYSEMQNEPRNPADCVFHPDQTTLWSDRFSCVNDLLRSMRSRPLIFGACDPSLGKEHGDPSAIITVAFDRLEGIVYVIGADIVNRRPDEILSVIRSYHEAWRYSRFAFEANQFQELLSDELLAMGVPIDPLTNLGNKQVRISSLQPFVASGLIQFDRRQSGLLEQLWSVPNGRHDDGPDALQMAFEIARKAPRVSADEEAELLAALNQPTRPPDDPYDQRWMIGLYDGRPMDQETFDRNFSRPSWW